MQNQIKILVVEDDREMREGLVEILGEEGYAVASADNGEGAISKFMKGDYDLVLTDLIMPGMSGMDVLREIKRLKPETHVIIITAFATIENAVEALKMGASDYIAKPFKENEVQVTIKKVLEEAKFKERSKVEPLSSILGTSSMIKSLSNPLRREIISLLDRKKKSRFRDIKEELGIDYAPKLSFHLKILKNAGLIAQDANRMYHLSSIGRDVAKALKHH